jgi:hypothetical protein
MESAWFISHPLQTNYIAILYSLSGRRFSDLSTCNSLGERGKGGRGGTRACSTRSRYLGDVARSSSLSAGTRFLTLRPLDSSGTFRSF